MTFRDGKYYCDICMDSKPIEKGTGFSFPSNALGIEHSHQLCYTLKQSGANVMAKSPEGKKYIKEHNINLTDKDIDKLSSDNLAEAKRLVEAYKKGEIKSAYDR